jgi:hypothetical protein
VPLIVAAAVAGAASSMATVLVLKVDMRWIKRGLSRLETRMDRVEKRVFQQ